MNIQKVLQGPQMKAAIEMEINIITVTECYSSDGFYVSCIFESNMTALKESLGTSRQA